MVAYACVGRPKVNCLLGLEIPALAWEPLYVRELTRVQWQPTLSGSPPEERTLDASYLSFRCLFIAKRRVVSRLACELSVLRAPHRQTEAHAVASRVGQKTALTYSRVNPISYPLGACAGRCTPRAYLHQPHKSPHTVTRVRRQA